MSTQARPRAASLDPLYVDLDGTLLATDTLWESLCALLRERARDLVRVPFWLRDGRAALKHHLACRVALDPSTLPYRDELLSHLAAERERGRPIVLATASDRRVADAVAQHLGLFDRVLASDGRTNLKGEAKLGAIEADSGGRFEYAGNSAADLPIWRGAQAALLVAPTAAAARGAASLAIPRRTLAPPRDRVGSVLRALRWHQWVKNLLLFVPLLLAHEIAAPRRLGAVALLFVCFCAVASATYLLNDLLDLDADRRHASKRHRPLASGRLPIPQGMALIAVLLAFGFGLALSTLAPAASGMLAIYLVLTVAYSFYLKQRLLVDVLLLAGLYTHRVISGGVAAQVEVSPWLLAFSMFFFLSLAFVKRYVELRSWSEQGREAERLDRRGYLVGDLPIVETMGLTSAYVSVLVLCLYVSSDAVSRLYRLPEALWLISLILLYWITRIWFLARRGQLPDDPVLFATRDRTSLVAGALIVAVGAVAAW